MGLFGYVGAKGRASKRATPNPTSTPQSVSSDEYVEPEGSDGEEDNLKGMLRLDTTLHFTGKSTNGSILNQTLWRNLRCNPTAKNHRP